MEQTYHVGLLQRGRTATAAARDRVMLGEYRVGVGHPGLRRRPQTASVDRSGERRRESAMADAYEGTCD